MPYQGSPLAKTAAAINAQIASIGATVTQLLLRTGEYTIDDDVTFPSNITLVCEPGCYFNISNTKTLTINGILQAEPYLLFTGLGTAVGSYRCEKCYPEWFGAVNDGTGTDDTAALQKCFDFASAAGISVIWNGQYYATDMIYLWGNANLIGLNHQESKLYFDCTANPVGSPYGWLILGCSSYGVSANHFTGVIRNIYFDISNVATQSTIVSYQRCKNTTIENCYFNVNQSGSWANCIEGQNFVGLCPTPDRDGIWIKNNRFEIYDNGASAGEASGMTNATNVWFVDNYFYGSADDAIGLHNVDDFVISGNQIYSVDGRIFIGNGYRGRVTNNYVERIESRASGWIAGVAGIYLGVEGTAGLTSKTCTDITVSGNTINFPAGNLENGYGIYGYGLRGCSITDNTVISDDISHPFGIIYLQPTFMDDYWDDPADIQPYHTGTAQSGGASSIQLDVGASAVDDYYNTYYVKIIAGTGVGEEKQIISYDGASKTATVDSAWIAAPDATSVFKVGSRYVRIRDVLVENNLSTGLYPKPFYVQTTNKEDVQGPINIRGNVATSYKVMGNNIFFDASNQLTAISDYNILHYGTAQAGGASSITLAANASSTNDSYNDLKVRIKAGVGTGQSRIISDYDGTTKVATVSAAWDTQPDATSEYELIPVPLTNDPYRDVQAVVTGMQCLGTFAFAGATGVRAVAQLVDGDLLTTPVTKISPRPGFRWAIKLLTLHVASLGTPSITGAASETLTVELARGTVGGASTLLFGDCFMSNYDQNKYTNEYWPVGLNGYDLGEDQYIEVQYSAWNRTTLPDEGIVKVWGIEYFQRR